NRYFDDFHNTANGNRGLPWANAAGGLTCTNTGFQAENWVGWLNAPIPATSFGNGIKNFCGENSTSQVRNDGSHITDATDPVAVQPLGYLEIDVNRVMQTIRTVLLKTRSLYTTISGFSDNYIGIGNEIGFDAANGFNAFGVPTSNLVFGGASGTHLE